MALRAHGEQIRGVNMGEALTTLGSRWTKGREVKETASHLESAPSGAMLLLLSPSTPPPALLLLSTGEFLVHRNSSDLEPGEGVIVRNSYIFL